MQMMMRNGVAFFDWLMNSPPNTYQSILSCRDEAGTYGSSLLSHWQDAMRAYAEADHSTPLDADALERWGTAAQCAGVGVGLYESFDEVKQLFRVEEEYLPDPAVAEFYTKKYSAFLEAYQGMLNTYDMIAELEQLGAE